MSAGAPTLSPPDRLSPAAAPSWSGSLRAIVHRGVRDRLRSTMIWGLALGTYGGFMAAVYPSIQGSLDQVLRNYPPALRQAFDVTSMGTVEGYIQAEMFSLIVPLVLCRFVIRAVTGPTVDAEARGHLDTILSLPIARSALMAGACLVAALSAAAVMILTGAITFAVGRLAGTGISPGLVTAGVLGVLPLALLAGGIAAVAAGALHSSGAAGGIALGAVIAMYGLDLAGRLAPALAPLRWASAFRYYGSPMLDGIHPVPFLGLTLVAVCLMVAGARLLERRDVRH
ncbi:MAG TPA: ABC transporter permease subunit [Solirubrobacteraceae bacterium]|nr:ABC transporter permease subunit [Solirubrobacteraceae bacterium]